VIAGSLGVLPSATIGGKVNLYEPCAWFRSGHRRKRHYQPYRRNPDRDHASAAFGWIGEGSAGDRAAVREVLEGGARTRDLARNYEQVVSTREMGALVARLVAPLRPPVRIILVVG
jgi:3-isopropylmalate dehydrogenase